ncbi:MAG: STAS domain-containing protein [Planctomycetaceae bacterium]
MVRIGYQSAPLELRLAVSQPARNRKGDGKHIAAAGPVKRSLDTELPGRDSDLRPLCDGVGSHAGIRSPGMAVRPVSIKTRTSTSPTLSTGKRIMASGKRRLDIDTIGDVTIARFIDKKILDETNIQIIGNQLFGVVEEDGRKRIILDFSNVEYLSSAALGKLITLEKKVKSAGGKLRLCSIRPDIYEVFAITKLNQVFDIKDDQDQAQEGF